VAAVASWGARPEVVAKAAEEAAAVDARPAVAAAQAVRPEAAVGEAVGEAVAVA
jgi:hypothetical protein